MRHPPPIILIQSFPITNHIITIHHHCYHHPTFYQIYTLKPPLTPAKNHANVSVAMIPRSNREVIHVPILNPELLHINIIFTNNNNNNNNIFPYHHPNHFELTGNKILFRAFSTDFSSSSSSLSNNNNNNISNNIPNNIPNNNTIIRQFELLVRRSTLLAIPSKPMILILAINRVQNVFNVPLAYHEHEHEHELQ
mmetsp:Transcript_4585/g.6506  ORF Transcript_4585/g.6506 Transcript_4585/m.6506 type:complete len:195 (-) Transcript_4585:868-1452(-)